ncbi:hypothetical protein [Bacillus haynesii]|uniref:Uncharacterized protein n=1 Tax=Bacillus haynesii TaxID=1925021 RepID=A0AA90J8B5_9BACI|nr:hypothetical protein [Bacillus haynesii]MCY7790806.1 hypothetical protein [Bacillus haynesii]MCY8068908.1 hypothetical protein [Bacillus haynesii]MCY8340380.1 hypothetical protein [Bacillus haynesii]MCY8384317.1 hypothetical protein [Bacillus haynesii]MCY9152216.1 hypothetical protein [Bacillus haynesii]
MNKDFLAKRVNSAIIVASIFGPFAWLCMFSALIWITIENKLPFQAFIEFTILISTFFLLLPICLLIYRKKVLFKKHPHLVRQKSNR